MAKKFPIAPQNPERICWGCDAYCPANDMRCGNGSDRTPHPAELFGEDWNTWGLDDVASPPRPAGEGAGEGVTRVVDLAEDPSNKPSP